MRTHCTWTLPNVGTGVLLHEIYLVRLHTKCKINYYKYNLLKEHGNTSLHWIPWNNVITNTVVHKYNKTLFFTFGQTIIDRSNMHVWRIITMISEKWFINFSSDNFVNTCFTTSLISCYSSNFEKGLKLCTMFYLVPISFILKFKKQKA